MNPMIFMIVLIMFKKKLKKILKKKKIYKNKNKIIKDKVLIKIQWIKKLIISNNISIVIIFQIVNSNSKYY